MENDASKIKDLLESDLTSKSDLSKIDNKSFKEMQDYEREGKMLDNLSKSQDIEERKNYASQFTTIVTVWLLFIIILIIGIAQGRLWLSENVILALIGTSTFNLIGLLYIVANYLFPKIK